MIPILYEVNETAFTSNGLGRLSDASRCIVTEERNGIYELEMDYPVDGVHFSDLVLSRFIKAIPSYKTNPQYFRIYNISREINGKVTVHAEHISYELLRIVTMPFTAHGVVEALEMIKDNAVGHCPFTFWTDKTDTDVYNLEYPEVIRSKLVGGQWSLNQQYEGSDWEWDNYTVKFWQQRGEDKGVVLRYGKNIVSLKQEDNIQNTYTGIVPYWFGLADSENETCMYLPEKVLYSEYVDHFPVQRTIAVDFTDQFETKPTEDQLRSAGRRYITKNKIGLPNIDINVSFVDLAHTMEYKDILPLMSVNLCDYVTVYLEKLGVNEKARVTRTVWNVLLDRYDSIYVGDAYHNLATAIASNYNQVNEVRRTAQTIAVSAAEAASKLITGNKGGYVVLYDADGDGKPDELLVMDTEDVETATSVWRWNNSGLGYSSTGYAGSYSTAITSDGQIVADFITAGTMSTDRIVSNGEALTTVLGTIQETIENNTALIFDAQSITAEIQTIITDIDSRVTDTDGDVTRLKTWISATQDGLTIAKNNSTMSSLFTNDSLQFLDDGVVVAYINGQKYYIKIGEIIDKLIFRHGADGTPAVAMQVNSNGHFVLKGDS